MASTRNNMKKEYTAVEWKAMANYYNSQNGLSPINVQVPYNELILVHIERIEFMTKDTKNGKKIIALYNIN